MSKFTKEEIEEMNKMYQAGKKLAEIGKVFGMTTSHVKYYVDPEYKKLIYQKNKKKRLANKKSEPIQENHGPSQGN